MSDPAEELAAVLDRARELLEQVSPGWTIRVDPPLLPPPEEPPDGPTPDGIPDKEAAILTALADRPLTSKQLVKAMGKKSRSGPFTVTLSHLRKYRGLLGHEPRGYFLTAKGHAALSSWRRQQLF